MDLQHKLKSNIYGVKAIDFELKDIDEATRTVKGRLSSFDTLDADRDIIRRGAFKKSLQERGAASIGNRKIAHLRHHDWRQPIGVFKELNETEKGLDFVSELGRATHGNDALLDYQDGIIKEHSIGFNYIADKTTFVDSSEYHKEGHWEITEIKLWEGSAVTFGANEFTPTLEANKSVKESDYLRQLNEEMTVLIGALKNGKGTDNRLENIELSLQVIQQKYNSLITEQPLKDTTRIEPIEAKQGTSQKKFLLSLAKL